MKDGWQPLRLTGWFSLRYAGEPQLNEVVSGSPPSEGGVAAASADGVVLYATPRSYREIEGATMRGLFYEVLLFCQPKKLRTLPSTNSGSSNTNQFSNLRTTIPNLSRNSLRS